jgi:chemotaxis protein histidine kinase CheA
VKVRGNAAHIAEKYLQLARDAQSSGDSVMAENYLQHAEHYFRIVSSAQQAQSGVRPEGQDDSDFDDDMPEMNSRFSSPQPQQAPQQNEGDEQNEGGEQRAQQGEQRPPRNERSRQRPDRERPDRERPAAAAANEGEASSDEQPAVANEAAPAADAAADAGETRKPRERRPRRRRPAGGDAGADPASSEQPEVGELPAFLTAGSGTAAE